MSSGKLQKFDCFWHIILTALKKLEYNILTKCHVLVFFIVLPYPCVLVYFFTNGVLVKNRRFETWHWHFEEPDSRTSKYKKNFPLLRKINMVIPLTSFWLKILFSKEHIFVFCYYSRKKLTRRCYNVFIIILYTP